MSELVDIPPMFSGILVDPDGRIVSRKSFPITDVGTNLATLQPGWRLLWGHENANADEVYIVGDEEITRPAFTGAAPVEIAADGVAVFRLEIDPATIVNHRVRDERGRLMHEPVDVTDGVFEFVTAVPGVYEFDIESVFPLRPATLRITAHAV